MAKLLYTIVKRCILIIAFLSLLVAQAAAQDAPNTSGAKEQSHAKPHKSPMGALLRSVAVPGWGQFYNGKYIKGTVVLVGESYFILRAVHWWRKTEDQYSLIQNLPTDERPAAFNTYESYRGSRNDFLWLVGLSVFISMFDAYVDAHLAGIDVDLTPDFDEEQSQASLKLTLRF